ncbi:enoyl-CoA hydratase-related protein [uncultured Tenacibaculum sp.]|uniref:enoyl-CoA hydratase-related protein n=1 Tax=uncultured Tenacibaculum sp. TaxID=174713 RepID=UPI00260E8E35|nr:enoyl-CoA hydratase-related protein [uncultured Tenacibaculum sp.]
MNVLFEKIDRIVIAKLNRPKALNALNSELMHELISGLLEHDSSQEIGCFIITGHDNAFCAGADIKEMAQKDFNTMFNEDYFGYWEIFSRIKTPVIAAVNGYAFGGGCELAMMCDIIYASENAQFGQPEIKLGVIPGIGGTQRLTKLVGKSKAMEIILTGKTIDAEEAERIGLVTKVLPKEDFTKQIIEKAQLIASYSKTALKAAKEATNQALESSLKDGIVFERKLFHSLFHTENQTEGMNAFLEKRTPKFN